jgi:hypothetical protein
MIKAAEMRVKVATGIPKAAVAREYKCSREITGCIDNSDIPSATKPFCNKVKGCPRVTKG